MTRVERWAPAAARPDGRPYVLALPAAITAGWIRGTVLSTNSYVAAVAPPVVRAAVRATVDGEVRRYPHRKAG